MRNNTIPCLRVSDLKSKAANIKQVPNRKILLLLKPIEARSQIIHQMYFLFQIRANDTDAINNSPAYCLNSVPYR